MYQPYQYSPLNNPNNPNQQIPSNNTYQPYNNNQQYVVEPSQFNPNIQPNQINNGIMQRPHSTIVRTAPQHFQKNLNENSTGLQLSLQERARKSFITKVYSLLTLQLLFTAIIGYIGYNNENFKKIFVNIPALIILSVALIAVTIVISCFRDFYRRHVIPIFIIFTALFAILVAISITAYTSKVIIMAVVATLVVTIALTIYAWTTDSDLTGMGAYLCIFAVILFIFGIATIFWNNPIVQLVYSCLAALLYGIYLIYDTQMVIGRGQYKYSLDDAFDAAIHLYIDIIQMFLNLLRIIGSVSGN